jgi:hypothetical protein
MSLDCGASISSINSGFLGKKPDPFNRSLPSEIVVRGIFPYLDTPEIGSFINRIFCKNRTYANEIYQKLAMKHFAKYTEYKNSKVSWKEHYFNCYYYKKLEKAYDQGRDFFHKTLPIQSYAMKGITAAAIGRIFHGSTGFYASAFTFLAWTLKNLYSELPADKYNKNEKLDDTSRVDELAYDFSLIAPLAVKLVSLDPTTIINTAGLLCYMVSNFLYQSRNIQPFQQPKATKLIIAEGFGYGFGTTLAINFLKVASIGSSTIVGLGCMLGYIAGDLPFLRSLNFKNTTVNNLLLSAGGILGAIITGIPVSSILSMSYFAGCFYISDIASKIFSSKTTHDVLGSIGSNLVRSTIWLKENVSNLASKVMSCQTVKNVFGYISNKVENLFTSKKG